MNDENKKVINNKPEYQIIKENSAISYNNSNKEKKSLNVLKLSYLKIKKEEVYFQIQGDFDDPELKITDEIIADLKNGGKLYFSHSDFFQHSFASKLYVKSLGNSNINERIKYSILPFITTILAIGLAGLFFFYIVKSGVDLGLPKIIVKYLGLCLIPLLLAVHYSGHNLFNNWVAGQKIDTAILLNQISILYQKIATNQILDKQFDKAKVTIKKGIAINSDYSLFNPTQAICYLADNDYQKAKQIIYENIKTNSNEKVAFINLLIKDLCEYQKAGIELNEMDKVLNQLFDFEEYISSGEDVKLEEILQNNTFDYLFNKSEYFRLNALYSDDSGIKVLNLRNSLVLLEKALSLQEKKPSLIEHIYLMFVDFVWNLLQTGNYNEAKKNIEWCKSIINKETLLLPHQLYAHLFLEEKDEAKTLYNRLSNLDDNKLISDIKTLNKNNNGTWFLNYLELKVILPEIAKIEEKAYAYNSPGKRHKNLQPAIVLYDKILLISDDPKIINNAANSFVEFAWNALLVKNFDEAMEYIQKALNLCKDLNIVYPRLALIYLYNNDLQNAIEICELWNGKLCQGEKTFNRIIFEDILVIEKYQISHPDLNKLKKFANK